MSDATGDTSWDYTYDGLHLNKQTTPQGVVSYLYDGDGRRSQMSLAGQSGAWAYGYDNGGRLTSLQSPTDGPTSYTYDGVGGRGTKDAAGLTQWGLLSTKTKGSGDYELYDYDACNELTSIGYWFYGGTMQNGLTYSYDLAGNVKTMNQGYYATTYGYDGADQLTSESSTGGTPPPSLGYTYDKNGNRLTTTVNGTQTQSFGYDAHDKLVSGTAGNETDGYDANGSETSTTISGSTFREVYDDEDRMTSLTLPSGIVDTFVYNGLGLRVGKTDSTGTYSYVCDGTSPGSPVLADGHALYTPGLSENRNGTAAYYSLDRLGNLWTLDGTTKNQLGYEDFAGFGGVLAQAGSGSPFGYGGGSGCQTDADTGLVLMGHRYYDTRIGRFISQDPTHFGRNWYAYCGNNPVNKTDPTGLSDGLPGSLGAPDSHYGGLGGALDGDPDGLFSGGGTCATNGDPEGVAALYAAVMFQQANYEVSHAYISSEFSAADKQTMMNTLQDMLETPEGERVLAQGYLNEAIIVVQSMSAADMEHVPTSTGTQNGWPAYTRGGIIYISPASLQYEELYRQDGYQTETLSDVLIHELGHAMTGIGDSGPGHMDNVLINENPVDEALGIWPRLSYDKLRVKPNPDGIQSGDYP